MNMKIFGVAWMLLCFANVAGAQLRVASLNLDKRHGPEIVATIQNSPDLRKADILLLQELVDSPSDHMPAEIASALGMQVVFAPAFRLNDRFEEGLAILSRYPLSARTVIPLSHNRLHFHTRIRIALSVTAALPNGPVQIVDLHLDNRINDAAKQEQLDEIWHGVASPTGPCLIGGDFNSGNFRWLTHIIPLPGLQSLRKSVDKGMKQHGFSTPLGSGPATLHWFGLKLDWIYLRGFRAEGSGVTPIHFSDHNSVWVSFREP